MDIKNILAEKIFHSFNGQTFINGNKSIETVSIFNHNYYSCIESGRIVAEVENAMQAVLFLLNQ